MGGDEIRVGPGSCDYGTACIPGPDRSCLVCGRDMEPMMRVSHPKPCESCDRLARRVEELEAERATWLEPWRPLCDVVACERKAEQVLCGHHWDDIEGGELSELRHVPKERKE